MSEIDETAVIEDYENQVPLGKIYKKHGINSFDLGMIIGKHNIEKRVPLKGGYVHYPEDSWKISKSYATFIPRNIRDFVEAGQMLKWTKSGKNEFKVTVTA